MKIRENMAHYRRMASVGAATFLVLLFAVALQASGQVLMADLFQPFHGGGKLA